MTASTTGKRLRAPGSTLGRELAESLRTRIIESEFSPGSRLPSETTISEEYGVSRVTVRTAIKLLESQGIVHVRHGSGTYVADFGGQVRTGLQELRSITETIRQMGFMPRMDCHRIEQRPATEDEAAKLGLPPNSSVVSVERAIMGDDVVMAYSYDVLPAGSIPPERLGTLGTSSLFATMDEVGLKPTRALAELHAVSSDSVGWGPNRPTDGLYLLLDQLHQDAHGAAVAYSKTYFVEGRFQFVILRTR